MCFQDVQISRSSRLIRRTVTLDTTVLEVLPFNRLRIGVIFTNHATDDLQFWPQAIAQPNTLFTLFNDGPPLDFNYQQHGALVQEAWFGIAPGGATTAEIIEIILEAQTSGELLPW